MSDDTEQNRSEPPTAYKLARAREKGTVARGLDLGFFTGLAVLCGYGWIAGPELGASLSNQAKAALVSAPVILGSRNELLAATASLIAAAARPVALLAGFVFLAVLVLEIVQTGLVFSTEPLKPDFGRLSPTRGFKRVFSLRMLIETAKSIAKLLVFGAIATTLVIYTWGHSLPALTGADALARLAYGIGLQLLLLFTAAAALFAGVDQLIARRDFLTKMRMSRREIKRELRDREGDQRLKQRRLKLHREFVQLSQSVRNVRGADMLITNPVKLAVALRYDPKTMPAPRVVSKGSHQFAARLRGLAFVYGVVLVENKALARALYFNCDLNQEIPAECFRAVADIYLTLRRRRAEQQQLTQHA